MTIKSMTLNNFKGFEHISINLDPTRTLLVGPNGSGKTTLGMDAVWAIFKGVGEKGDVFKGERRLIIKGQASENQLVLTDGWNDWVINRRITADRSTVEVICPDGTKRGQDFLDAIFDSAMLNPLAFSRLDPTEQCKVLGVDVSGFNEELRALKEEHLLLGRELRAFGDVTVPEEVPFVDVSELSAKKDKIIDSNNEQAMLSRERSELEAKLRTMRQKEEELKLELEQLAASCARTTSTLEATPIPQPVVPTDEIDAKLRSASDENERHFAYKEAVKRSQLREEKSIEVAKNKSAQEEVVERRTRYVQSQELPYTNLTVDDDGRLLFDGRPIREKNLSDGEMIKLCILLTRKKMDGFNYAFIEDFSLLDDDNQAQVSAFLEECGIQAVYELVRKTSDEPNTIILEKINKT